MHSGWGPLRSIRYGLGLIVAWGILEWPAALKAQNCPGTITTGFTLSSNLTATSNDSNPCISIGADNITINLNGNTLDISALGDSGVAIETNGHFGITIVGNGGTILTGYTSSSAAQAIHISGASGNTVTGITFTNNQSTCSTTGNTPANGFGTAILVENASGAAVTSNKIYCYLVGIAVANSAVPRRGTGQIAGNTLTNNTNPTLLGAAIQLSGSSGWTIENNQATYNGGNLTNGCKDSSGHLSNCSAALQLINNSHDNEITNLNFVHTNYGPGIYAASGTSGNRITSNDAQFNPTGDLWDDNPTRTNFWNKNTCGLEVGSVAPQKCPS